MHSPLRAVRAALIGLTALVSGCVRHAHAQHHGDSSTRAHPDAAPPHDAAADASAPSASDPISWQLTAEPPTPTITMAQRRAFRLWMVARNTGSRAVDTRRDQLEWRINGRASMEIAMAFGNGGREARWSALAPGATAREAREMGETLFPAPGTYEITARQDGREVARLRVQVVAAPH